MMKIRTSAGWTQSLGWAALVAMAVAPLGCGGEPEFAETPPDAGPPPPVPPPPPPEPVDAGPPPATTGPCDVIQTQAFTTMLQGRAPGEAINMQPEGPMLCGVVSEGNSIESAVFNLDPGHCYTVLGQGMPEVTEVDMSIDIDVAQLPPALQMFAGKPMLAVDSQTGVIAAIGGGKTCYAWPFPISGVVKLRVTAKQGSGPVAAQLYKRTGK